MVFSRPPAPTAPRRQMAMRGCPDHNHVFPASLYQTGAVLTACSLAPTCRQWPRSRVIIVGVLQVGRLSCRFAQAHVSFTGFTRQAYDLSVNIHLLLVDADATCRHTAPLHFRLCLSFPRQQVFRLSGRDHERSPPPNNHPRNLRAGECTLGVEAG